MVLSAFQTKWPEARLGVSNDRCWPYVPIDLDLLRCPQLHLLEFTIVKRSLLEPESEYPLIRQILLHSRNLRILRLDTVDNNDADFSYMDDILGPLNLQLTEGDTCPLLQELKLPDTYELDLEHCLTWQSCMDWSALRSLDLGERCSENFLSTLSGKVPKLERLLFHLFPGPNPSWTCTNMSVLRKFLNGIDGLQEVHIKNYCVEVFEEVGQK